MEQPQSVRLELPIDWQFPSAQSFGIWSDQLVSAPKATIVQENGAVNLLFDEARSQYPEASTREWLQVAESAFEFLDNPIDAAYDDL